MTAARRVAAGFARFWSGLIRTPIRDGRLRDTGWPVGLRPIVVVGVVAFCLAVILILLAPAIRAASPLSVSVGAVVLSLPRIMLPTIFWLVILSIALAQTAALHVRARVAAVLTGMTILIVLFLGGLDVGADGEGGVGITPGKVVSIVAASAILALVLARRRRQFAWWEFPLVLAIIAGSATLSLGRNAEQGLTFGLDFGPTTASLIMSSIGQLAVPAALAAGVAVAEFAITASTAAVSAAHRPPAPASAPPDGPDTDHPAPRRRPIPLVLLGAFILVALWRVVEFVVGLVTGASAPVALVDLPLSAAIVAAIAGLWWMLARVRGSSSSRISTIMSHLDSATFPVAVALSITLAPVVALLLTVQVLTAWGVDPAASAGVVVIAEALRGSLALGVVRLSVGVGLIVIAVLLARRGGRGSPELLAAIGVIALLSAIPALTTAAVPWSSSALAVVVGLGTVLLSGVLAVRRELDARRLALLLTALLLSAAMAWREVIADPLSVVIGASGLALVLFGFVWGFLTDADVTHGDSAPYPRATRVLLFLANALFGVTVLAYGALARSLDAALDLDAFAQFGDQLLGTAVILAAVMAVWAATMSVDSRPSRTTVAP